MKETTNMGRQFKYNWEDAKIMFKNGCLLDDIVSELGCPKSQLTRALKKYYNIPNDSAKQQNFDLRLVKKINLKPFIPPPLDTVGHIPKHLYKLYTMEI